MAPVRAEFRLLGPLELLVDGSPVPLGGAKQQALLAYLLLHANEVVATGELRAALWDEPPRSAHTMVQMFVSRLRKVLESQRLDADCDPSLLTRSGGYLLRVDPDGVDLLRFQALTAQGRAAMGEGSPDLASVRFGEALALWRGPALCGLMDGPLGVAAGLRLQELRLAVVEDRVDADLLLGRHAELVPELELLVAEHPLRERFRAQLMLALYRAGRQADALNAFQQTRDALVATLGLEPGAELQRLQRAILVHDPELDAPAPRHAIVMLPKPAGALIGRDAELAALSALLGREDVRLVTLSGCGGVGKTRLALQAANELAASFGQGAVFVALDALADPDLVPSAIAGALELTDGRSPSDAEAVLRHLSSRSMLLVLDSFEHVLPATRFLVELLSTATNVKVVATSRAALRIAGEHRFPVPPLALPKSTDDDPVHLLTVPSVALFIERGRALTRNLDLGTESTLAIAEICRRLEGLPLSIELAAARTDVLPPPALLRRLRSRLDLLTSGQRDAPPRHRTLRETMGWSYELLSASERVMLERLAVFVGGFALEAAEGICDDDVDVLDAVHSLVDKSLVMRADAVEHRFAMLETVREYALEQLEARGELVSTRARHAAWFLALAEIADVELQGSAESTWLDRLEAERGNLRAAVRFSVEEKDGETALRLCGSLRRFWEIRGHLAEGRRLLEAALAIPSPTSPLVRIKALDAVGVLACEQGDFRGSRDSFARSVALAREHGADDLVARALGNLGTATLHAGSYDEAQAIYEEAVVLKRSSGNLFRLGMTLNNLACAAYCAGRLDDASAYLVEAETLARDEGDGYGIGVVLLSRAGVLLAQGEPERALDFLVESMSLATEMGWQQGIADCLEIVAGVCEARGELPRATTLLGAAEALRESIGAHLQPQQQMRHDELTASLREELEVVEFRAHHQRGRVLPLDDALQLASIPRAIEVTEAIPV